MKKIRTLGFGIVIAAGMAMFGTGVATADDTATGGTQEETTTGSADGLAEFLQALTTGSAGAEDPATDAGDAISDDATGDDGTAVETGSAEGLAAALEALLSGSAGAEEPTDPDVDSGAGA
ncbi:hypothetical protein [Nocardia sp. NPDC058633]|uniref:hypothetical protein n=1 Tax=Nocardia sp. NPDC058633 TaxID=3346568 RepID=UPI00366768DD